MSSVPVSAELELERQHGALPASTCAMVDAIVAEFWSPDAELEFPGVEYVEAWLLERIPELTRERARELALDWRARHAEADPTWPVCIACGCDEMHACTTSAGTGCHWAILNEAMGCGLCSVCGERLQRAPGPLVVRA